MSRQEIRYEDQDHMRLDLFLSQQFAEQGYTRSYWTNMIRGSFVHVNESDVKPGAKLTAGDEITIMWPEVDRSYADSVQILYDDDDVLVCNKPAGMLTHSKGAFNPEYSFADFIASFVDFPESDEPNTRAGVVHRLDRHTSGVLVAAKHPEALKTLQKQFESRTAHKTYVAVIEGRLNESVLRIDIPLDRDRKNPKRRAPSADGKEAITNVADLAQIDDVSLVALKPVTGRTHQLRVHLSHIGHPIFNDVLYGAREQDLGERFLLHAYSLEIVLPNGNQQTFVAPMPEDMSSYITDEDRLSQSIEDAFTASK